MTIRKIVTIRMDRKECPHHRGRAALQAPRQALNRVRTLAPWSYLGPLQLLPHPQNSALGTRDSGLATLLSHLLLRSLPRRLRPLPLLIPPIMKRLVRRLFLHPSSLHPTLVWSIPRSCGRGRLAGECRHPQQNLLGSGRVRLQRLRKKSRMRPVTWKSGAFSACGRSLYPSRVFPQPLQSCR